jgi:hypothetical protein
MRGHSDRLAAGVCHDIMRRSRSGFCHACSVFRSLALLCFVAPLPTAPRVPAHARRTPRPPLFTSLPGPSSPRTATIIHPFKTCPFKTCPLWLSILFCDPAVRDTLWSCAGHT